MEVLHSAVLQRTHGAGWERHPIRAVKLLVDVAEAAFWWDYAPEWD